MLLQDVLKKPEYFGKFGKIHKVVINQNTAYAGSQTQVSERTRSENGSPTLFNSSMFGAFMIICFSFQRDRQRARMSPTTGPRTLSRRYRR